MQTEVKSLGTMHVDEEAVQAMSFEVSNLLGEKLEEQRRRLDGIDLKQPPAERYQLARAAGVLAAVATGVKNRTDRANEIFLPKSELRNGNGLIRISSLKAEIPVPVGVKVKSVAFIRGEDGWQGRVIVVT